MKLSTLWTLAALLAGCGGYNHVPPDSSVDVAGDTIDAARTDTATDVVIDAGRIDTVTDAVTDGVTDTVSEAADGGSDAEDAAAGTDVPDEGLDGYTADEGIDVTVDSPVEGGDAAHDGPLEAAADAAGDVPDAARDAGCATGSTLCGGSCVTLQDSPRDCGSCGNDCTSLPGVVGAAVRCIAGVCSVTGACSPGRLHCSSRSDVGCEVDAAAAANCGACGTMCSGATPLCSVTGGSATCIANCGTTTPCGASCVDLANDLAHCGACATACAADPHGTVA
ncbi:MAG: hypothetical protein WCJ30_25905, partial [Deltaproteobacteria bacterium]